MNKKFGILIAVLASVAGISAFAPLAHAAPGDGARKVVAENFADPGFGKFTTKAQGTKYYLYATGGAFKVARSSSVMSGYSIVGRAMPEKPAWVRDTDRDQWAPHVFQTSRTAGAEKFTLYFTARRKGDGKHCIGAAYSDLPTGPFTPAANPLACPPSGFAEAIDSVGYVSRGGDRYVVYKVGVYSPARRFRIMALRVNNERGVYRASGATPRVVLSERQIGTVVAEAPDLVHTPNGRVHLFVSRYTYSKCDYSTQVWSGDSIFSLGMPRWVRGMGPETGDRFCGPGGAEIIRDGSRMFMAFHARVQADPLIRHAFVGEVTHAVGGVWTLR